jgi:alpha-D-xyloside xylohydrolase
MQILACELAEGVLRLAASKDGQLSPLAKDILLNPGQPAALVPSVSQPARAGAFSIQEDSGRVTVSHSGTSPGNEKRLTFQFDGASLNLQREQDEQYYGFGEWFNGFARGPGTKLEIYNRESPAFSQHKHTYSAIPLFFSTRSFAVLVLNSFRADVSITDGEVSLDFDGGELDLVIVLGESLKDTLSRYTGITGRPPLLPRWAFGLWNTGFPVENEEETISRVEEHRRRGHPLDCVILDYHWEAAFHNFRFRRELFPDPARFVKSMKERGARVGLIYTPYINKKGLPLFKLAARLYLKNAPRGVPLLSQDVDEAFYKEGFESRYFAHPDFVWWLGRAGAVDFTNRAAVNWWFARQKQLLDLGISFFKNDGGEYLPDNAVSAEGLRSGEHHNIYSFYYARAVFEETQKHLGQSRALVFSRTAWAGTQRFPGIFLGDQTPEAKHIRSTMRASLNMSLQGFAYYGADVFGLYGKLTAEKSMLQSRWALFTPIARYFSSVWDKTRNPWGTGPEAEDDFKRHALLRMRLLPYYYTLARQAYDTGIPILRPLLMEFPEDDTCLDLSDQCMIGEALLLAPHAEKSVRRVYLPAGRWFCYFTGREFSPGWHEIPFGKDVPLFVRGGHIIPTGPELTHIPDEHKFLELELRAYPGGGRCRIYDDDGMSLAYQRPAGALDGQWIEVELTEARKIQALQQSAAQKSGFSGLPPNAAADLRARSIRIIFPGSEDPGLSFELRNTFQS